MIKKQPQVNPWKKRTEKQEVQIVPMALTASLWADGG